MLFFVFNMYLSITVLRPRPQVWRRRENGGSLLVEYIAFHATKLNRLDSGQFELLPWKKVEKYFSFSDFSDLRPHFFQPFCFLPENGFVMINVLLSLYPSLRSHTVYSCNNKFKSVILSAVSAFKRKREKKKKTFLRSSCRVNSIVHLHTLVCCCDLWHSFSICTVQLYDRKKEKN